MCTFTKDKLIKTFDFSNSFKYPLFDSTTEQNLLKLIELLHSKNISKFNMTATEIIISKLIEENKLLKSKIDFNDIYQELSEKYAPHNIDSRLLRVKSNIKTINFKLSIIKPFCKDESKEICRILSRYYFQKQDKMKQDHHLMLHYLFVELYEAYLYVTEF